MKYFLPVLLILVTSCSQMNEKPMTWDKGGELATKIENRFPEISFSRNWINRGDMQMLEVDYREISSWDGDDLRGSLEAFVRGCEKKSETNVPQICDRAKFLQSEKVSPYQIKLFFENNFTPYLVIDYKTERLDGVVTGYYVPLLEGSRKKTSRFKYPIYKKPRDYRLPYKTHEQIDKGIDADVICWVEDRVERAFLHIQGSGTIRLRDGSKIGVGFAGQNGYKYRSIGKYINKKFKVPLYKLSAQYIKSWIRDNPEHADDVLYYNRSFIFFEETGAGVALGSLGTNLVPRSTIAVDRKFIPLNLPVFIEEKGSDDGILNHLFIAQDVGGAIKGRIRADLFFGFGNKAGELAGKMKRDASFFILLPHGYKLPPI
ncbi:membrane-bound lytic murein transglycosylase [Thiovulum sp. ES]|nr:membrane-bound lytic murein transglycosylase [Thiovulum sp. ES]